MCCFLEKKTPFKQNKIKLNEEIHEKKNPIISVNKSTLATFTLSFPSSCPVVDDRALEDW